MCVTFHSGRIPWLVKCLLLPTDAGAYVGMVRASEKTPCRARVFGYGR